MIKNRDIIVFGDDWGRYPSTIQHLGRVWAKDNRIAWIGSLGLRRPRFTLGDLRRVMEKATQLLSRRTSMPREEFVHLLSPMVIPFHDVGMVRAVNNMSIRSRVASTVKKMGMHDPILITSNPIIGELIGTLGEKSSHYICLDDFTLFEGAFRCIESLEKILLTRIDSCFSVSANLLRTRRALSGENHFLPQGVDTKHFTSTGDIDARINMLPRPVVGFFGLLTSWVDLQLIIDCAKAYPKSSVVVLGRTAVDVTSFKAHSNIHYLGEVPFADLPRYARGFDVGLIPFIVNDLTIAANPLKLLEYLSLGIPVVSTALPEVEKFSEYVFIGHDREEFVRLVGRAVSDASPERKKKRVAIASQYSWHSIAESMSQIIQRIEETKKK